MEEIDYAALKAVVPILFGSPPHGPGFRSSTGFGFGYGYGTGYGSGSGIGSGYGTGSGLDITKEESNDKT